MNDNINFYIPPQFDGIEFKANFLILPNQHRPIVIITKSSKLIVSREMIDRVYYILNTWIKDHKIFTDVELKSQFRFVLDTLIRNGDNSIIGFAWTFNNEMSISMFSDKLYFQISDN